jgi:hypothetical protein
MFWSSNSREAKYRRKRADVIAATMLRIQHNCSTLSLKEAANWMTYNAFTYVIQFGNEPDREERREYFKDTLNRIDMNYVFIERQAEPGKLRILAEGYQKLNGLTLVAGAPVGLMLDERTRASGKLGVDTLATQKLLLARSDFTALVPGLERVEP